MLLGQVIEESASLHATEEYASGAEYEWRSDLGNTVAGDGVRYKGRTLIQITGRHNYLKTSQWAFARKMVPTPTYFVDHPADLAQMKYAWVGPAQYWLAHHNHGYGLINKAADANDIVAATYMVNGAQNGIDTRRLYWTRALNLGSLILPTVPKPAPVPNTASTQEYAAMAQILYVDRKDCEKKKAQWPGYFMFDGYNLVHIASSDRLQALQRCGIPQKTITLWMYRALGGK